MNAQIARHLGLMAAISLCAAPLPLLYAAPSAIGEADSRTGTDRETCLTGTVSGGFNGYIFNMVDERDYSYRIYPDSEPPRLAQGDKISVTGEFDGTYFRATEVQLIEDDRPFQDNALQSGMVHFGGTVQRIIGNHDLDVRGDNGRIYRVESRELVPADLREGTPLRAEGQFSGGTVFVDRLIFPQQPEESAPNQPCSAPVDFYGRIDYINWNARMVGIRADDRRTYEVHVTGKWLNKCRVGDKIEVKGTATQGRIEAYDFIRTR